MGGARTDKVTTNAIPIHLPLSRARDSVLLKAARVPTDLHRFLIEYPPLIVAGWKRPLRAGKVRWNR
jgi:hypothetical protein